MPTRTFAGGLAAAAVLALGSVPALATNPCYLLGADDGYFRLAIRDPASLVTRAEVASGAPRTTTYAVSGFFNSITGFQVADGSVLVTPNVGAGMGLTGHSVGVGILDVSCHSSQASPQPSTWSCRLTIVSATQGVTQEDSTLTQVNPAVTPACRVPATG